jgi:hypothetical protein
VKRTRHKAPTFFTENRGLYTSVPSRMASINRTAFRAYKGRLISIGLTYPSDYPKDPKLCKKHLEALHKRLKRMYGPSPASGEWGSSREGSLALSRAPLRASFLRLSS